MKDLDQQIINFKYDQNFKNEDFYISKSNKVVFDILESWPKWEKNFLNIVGEKFSGKTHLINIFLRKFKGIKFEAQSLNENNIKEIKIHQNIVLENLDEKVNEKLIYTLLNIIEQENKYLIATTLKPIVNLGFNLPDLKSEFNELPHVKGTLSMARSADPNSANSQFFICFESAPFLDRQYTVFGKVIEGMEFVDKIKRGDSNNNGSVDNPDKIISFRSE